MGIQNRNTEREGPDKNKNCKETNKMLQSLVYTTIISLSVGAPQYGGVQPSPPVKTAPLTGSVQCRTEYATLWDTEYKETETEVCTTEYEKVCRTETQRLCQPTTRQECTTVYEKQCSTVYRNVCVDQYKTEYEPYTETECSTEYKEHCEHQWQGEGNNKVWVPIPGTCKTNPHDQCRDVTKQKARQVAYPVCRDVPEQQCADVPRQACRQVSDQVCSNQALEQCSKRPVEQCHAVHKKSPVRVSKRVPKKVCDHGYAAPTPVSSNQPEIFDARNNQQASTKNQKIVFA